MTPLKTTGAVRCRHDKARFAIRKRTEDDPERCAAYACRANRCLDREFGTPVHVEVHDLSDLNTLCEVQPGHRCSRLLLHVGKLEIGSEGIPLELVDIER